ncbi:DUF309 domain-containing protein [Salinicoccus sp. ID82-1]|uniref:DUF309 domain-containing protein n=1 Tax=Salinicoccus sp. ID82-1 TaxID=2820269 RepID=UPI001F3CC225|nr:DUF309 domain-containing protein [Salinicoccus sp. ID82-1]MCG1009067.1 DUF309 domain-containing protein [Salinicoccus sp. ID82-1]
MQLLHLMDFYNELIIKQDYFECHEIMEEAWKSKPMFTKKDAEVFLILLATGEYHYRRQNITGAVKSYGRALRLYRENDYDLASLGVTDDLIGMMHRRLARMPDAAFTPMPFPLTDRMWRALHQEYAGGMTYEAFRKDLEYRFVSDEAIVHKHRLRDRSDVIREREAAIKKRKHQR